MDSIISLLTPKSATYYIEENSTIRQALEKFDAHKFSVVPLIDEKGRFAGTLSEGDILRFIKNQANFNLKIAENFSIKDIDHYRPYKALTIEASMMETLALSLEQNFIPIIDDNDIYIGIIKRRDIINFLRDKRELF